MRSWPERLRQVVVALLVLALAYEAWILGSGYLSANLRSFAGLWALPAAERSILLFNEGRTSEAKQALGLLQLIQQTPATSTVILPPSRIGGRYGNVGLMQYLTLPRRTANCPNGVPFEVCEQQMIGPTTVLVAVAGFPPDGTHPAGKTYVGTPGGLGLWIPSVMLEDTAPP